MDAGVTFGRALDRAGIKISSVAADSKFERVKRDLELSDAEHVRRIGDIDFENPVSAGGQKRKIPEQIHSAKVIKVRRPSPDFARRERVGNIDANEPAG